MLLLLWLVIAKFCAKEARDGVGGPAQLEH